jgi:hypothetical protein
MLARSGPLVLTGYSMGGPYIAIYTKLYGHEARLVYAEAARQYLIELTVGRGCRQARRGTLVHRDLIVQSTAAALVPAIHS